MKKFFNFIIWLLVIVYISFIFSNSLMSGEASGELSYKVAKTFLKIFERFEITMSLKMFHSLLRKVAHFVEFFGLGVLVSIAITTCPLFKSKTLNFTLFLLAIPTCDELIQYYVPDRVSTYKDMIIDASGMLLGGFVVYVSILIIKDIFKIRQKVA
ncbi:MAG: VanZ family protein [Erysipelotrichaceae bacterium]|nr:VanZ family protein [Erysipelotrichaceae bacterium]